MRAACGSISSGMRGVALVAVLWMMGALSILAAGLAHVSRGEIRSAALVTAAVEAATLGEAAVQLLMLEMRSGVELPPGYFTRSYELDGKRVSINVVPVSGLIDINAAGEQLLRELFVVAAGRDEVEAETIARRIVEWRSAGGSSQAGEYESAGRPEPRAAPFEHPEDLLQVLGVEFGDYDRIKSLITVFSRSPGVDPAAATEAVLRVLAQGDAEVSRRIAMSRENEDPVFDTTGLMQDYFGAAGVGVYRMDAYTHLGDRAYKHTRWASLASASPLGAPWRTLRIEPVTAAAISTSPQDGL